MVRRRSHAAQPYEWTSAAARRLRTMAGDAPTVEIAVKVIAARLLDGVPCPPTALDALCDRLGVTACCAEDLPVDGELRRDGRGYKIAYAIDLPVPRRRFTIAHEMGHLVFEGSGPRPPRSGAELERICDMLATEILLPAETFAAFAGDTPDLRKVFDLARAFETSVSTTAKRCCEVRGVSAFEVDAATGRLAWRRGMVKALTPALRPLVDRVIRAEHVAEVVLLEDRGVPRECFLEGYPLARGTRALFLLRPLASL